MAAIVLASTENMPYEEWLAYRRLGIGGSDASIVCGINRYKSPVELWMDKTNQIPDQEAGEAAYWGTQLEPFVRAEFTKRTGIEVIQTNQLLQSDEHPFMLANLDGICEHPDLGSLKQRQLRLIRPGNGKIRFRMNISFKSTTIWQLPDIWEPILQF